MNKKLIFAAFTSLLSLSAMAQDESTVTIITKPGPNCGQDAWVWMLDGNCIPSGYTTTPADLNFGDQVQLPYVDWTWYAGGCSSGTIRSFICFNDINCIPKSAKIVKATLRLWGVPVGTWGDNSYYPGSGFPTNEGWLQRVTKAWNEHTITWNNQPPTTTANQVSLPVSASQWSWNPAFDVTNIVQDIVSSSQNYGFMLQLQNEDYYRSVFFASSDEPNASLRPELEVTYVYDCSKDGQKTTVNSNFVMNGMDKPGSLIKKSDNEMSVFPNPANETVSVSFKHTATETVNIRILNAEGKLVRDQKYQAVSGSNTVSIDVRQLAKGIYMVQLVGDGKATDKVITKSLTIQ